MLRRITIQNFRAFRSRITVNLRPITVLIGSNSSGKSTLLKFLLMLQQSLGQHDRFLITEGSRVQLGAFEELRNARSQARYLRFEIEMESSRFLQQDLVRIKRVRSSKRRSSKKRGSTPSEPISVQFQLDPEAAAAKQGSSAVFLLSGRILYDSEQRTGSQRLQVRTNGKEVFSRSISIADSHLLNYRPLPRHSRNFESFLKHAFELGTWQQPIQETLGGLRHLSPIREEFKRTSVLRTPPAGTVGESGEFTVFHLQRILKKRGPAAEFIAEHARKIANIDDLRFESQLKGYLGSARAQNPETLADTYLADFGFGVGQILPIIVQAALMKDGELFLVEQPEAHLHPTAQLALGNLFSNLWQARKVPSIIETHSANIVLRLRSLIASGDLDPDDVALAYFHHEKRSVAVKNLTIDRNGSIAKGLPFEFFGADVLEAMKLGLGKNER